MTGRVLSAEYSRVGTCHLVSGTTNPYPSGMDQAKLSSALAALGHPMRIAIYRLLVEAGPAGRGPVAIGQLIDIPHNLVNYHLRLLVGAELVAGEKRGREVSYRILHEGMVEVLDSLAALARPLDQVIG